MRNQRTGINSAWVYGSFPAVRLFLTYEMLGSFNMEGRHSAEDMRKLIGEAVFKRLAGSEPNIFISNFAPVNKTVVRIYRECSEPDEYCWLCCVYFFQLVMGEAVAEYLNADTSKEHNDESSCIKCDNFEDEDTMKAI